jgi:hypothetical protein
VRRRAMVSSEASGAALRAGAKLSRPPRRRVGPGVVPSGPSAHWRMVPGRSSADGKMSGSNQTVRSRHAPQLRRSSMDRRRDPRRRVRRPRANPARRAAGAQRDRHVLRRRGPRSVPLHGGHEERRGRRVDEGAGGLRQCVLQAHSRPRRALQRDRSAATRSRRACSACSASATRSTT